MAIFILLFISTFLALPFSVIYRHYVILISSKIKKIPPGDKAVSWEGIFLKNIESGMVQLIKTDNAALILSDQDVEPGRAST